jgi:hypothetical protein
MNVYLMKAQLFQMVRTTYSSPDGFGVLSSGSDLPPPPPPRTMVDAFMAAQKGMLCQILQMQQQLVQMMQQQSPFGANLADQIWSLRPLSPPEKIRRDLNPMSLAHPEYLFRAI